MPRRRGDSLVANEARILDLMVRMAGESTRPGPPRAARLYGYPIFQRLNDEAAEDEPRISDATVYRCLRRLEERGALVGQWEAPDEPAPDGRQGRPRRYYQLTPDATALLAASRAQLDALDRRPEWYRRVTTAEPRPAGP